MKLPNGYGSVVKLSGARRRPYMARKTIGYNENRSPIYNIIGYYSTKEEALHALAIYNAKSTPTPIITFAKVYQEWVSIHSKEVTVSTINNYCSAFKHCQDIAGKPIDAIKQHELQTILSNLRDNGLSYSTAKKVRTLLSLVFNHALITEHISKNHCHSLKIGKNRLVRPHKTFTRQAINKLWKSDEPFSYIPLILLYTGMRSKELRDLLRCNVNLRNKTITIASSKTAAGIRVIPIHSRILPIITTLCNQRSKYLLGARYTYNRLAREFAFAMKRINSKHTTHDCRHTFATLLDRLGANHISKRKLLGHASGDVTDKVYTHKSLRDLRKCIELLP